MGQPITDPTSGSSFDVDVDPDPELDNKCQSSPLCSAHDDDADLDLYDWLLALMRVGRRRMLLEESGMMTRGLRLSVFGRPCLDH